MSRRGLRCAWIAPPEEPQTRMLVPGCPERVQDWDAPCTCKTTDEELAEAEARSARLEAKLDRARDRYQALMGAVSRRPDASAIFKEADASFAEWRRMKDAVRKQNETFARGGVA